MIPKTLRDIPQWVVWRHERGTKVPYRIDGRRADKTDEGCWVDYETAAAAAEKFDGIGFCFTEQDGLAGVDLDDCLETGGRVKEWAREILRLLPSYAEVSPSGNGVKVFLRGIKPLGCRTRVDVGDGRLEVYDRGAYFTVTGIKLPNCRSEVHDCQAGLDEIVARWLTPPPRPLVAPVTHSQGETLRRAAEIVRHAKPAIAGQGGHNQTYRVALHLLRGLGLSVDDAFQYLDEYNNLKCDPPWTEKELRHKLDSAAKASAPEGYLLLGEKLDLGRLANEPPAEQPRPVLEKYEDLIDDAPGLLKDMASWVLDNSQYPQPPLALGTSIAMWGTVLGRRVCGPRDVRTNVYILCLAPSSSGKDDPLNAPYRIFQHIPEARDLIGVRDFASRMTFQRHLEAQPCMLFAFDEADGLFLSLKDKRATHMTRLADDFKAIWSASKESLWKGIGFADVKRDITINQPHACLLCVAVPEKFYASVDVTDIEGGLMPRFLLFTPEDDFPPENPLEVKIPPPPKLVRAIRDWLSPGWGNLAEMNPAPRLVEPDPEAREILKEYRVRMRDEMRRLRSDDAIRAAAIGKTAEQAAKLALIAACAVSTEYQVITPDCAAWGVRVAHDCATRLADQLERHVSHNRHEALVKDILAYGQRKGRVRRSELTRRFRSATSKQLEEALSQLVHGEECQVVRTEGDGRPAIWYVFVAT